MQHPSWYCHDLVQAQAFQDQLAGGAEGIDCCVGPFLFHLGGSCACILGFDISIPFGDGQNLNPLMSEQVFCFLAGTVLCSILGPFFIVFLVL